MLAEPESPPNESGGCGLSDEEEEESFGRRLLFSLEDVVDDEEEQAPNDQKMQLERHDEERKQGSEDEPPQRQEKQQQMLPQGNEAVQGQQSEVAQPKQQLQPSRQQLPQPVPQPRTQPSSQTPRQPPSQLPQPPPPKPSLQQDKQLNSRQVEQRTLPPPERQPRPPPPPPPLPSQRQQLQSLQEDNRRPAARSRSPRRDMSQKVPAAEDIEADWRTLSMATPALQNDPELVGNAMRASDGEALAYSETLRKDGEFVFGAAQEIGSQVIQFAADELRADRDFVLQAVQQLGAEVLMHISPSLHDDWQFMMEAIEYCPPAEVLHYVPESLKDQLLSDRDFVYDIIKEVGADVLEAVPESWHDDRDFVSGLAGLCSPGEMLEFASDRLRSELLADRDFIADAVRLLGPDILEEVSPELRSDPTFARFLQAGEREEEVLEARKQQRRHPQEKPLVKPRVPAVPPPPAACAKAQTQQAVQSALPMARVERDPPPSKGKSQAASKAALFAQPPLPSSVPTAPPSKSRAPTAGLAQAAGSTTAPMPSLANQVKSAATVVSVNRSLVGGDVYMHAAGALASGVGGGRIQLPPPLQQPLPPIQPLPLLSQPLSTSLTDVQQGMPGTGCLPQPGPCMPPPLLQPPLQQPPFLPAAPPMQPAIPPVNSLSPLPPQPQPLQQIQQPLQQPIPQQQIQLMQQPCAYQQPLQAVPANPQPLPMPQGQQLSAGTAATSGAATTGNAAATGGPTDTASDEDEPDLNMEPVPENHSLLQAVKVAGPQVLEHASAKLRSSRQFMLAASACCANPGDALRFATKKLRRQLFHDKEVMINADKDLMLLAAKEFGVKVLAAAPAELLGDFGFMLHVTSTCGKEALEYTSPELRAELDD